MFLLVFTLLPCLATERIFILKNEGEIVQYKIRDKQEEVKQVASYSDQDFPRHLPRRFDCDEAGQYPLGLRPPAASEPADWSTIRTRTGSSSMTVIRGIAPD